jgi:hypothetical protein
MKLWVAVLAAPALLAATVVRAQAPPKFEAAPFVGWRTGASLLDSGDGGTYDVEASSSWGVALDLSLGSPGLFGELAFTRQDSRVSYDDAFGQGRSDVTLDSLLVGGQWVSAPREPIRPFLSALVGVTRIASPGSAATHFTGSLSGGVKLMASDAFGVRLEARALAIFAGGSAAGLCGESGCTIGLSGWGTLQADFSGGVVLGF